MSKMKELMIEQIEAGKISPVKFTQEARARILEFFKENCKHEIIDNFTVLEEVFAAATGMHFPGYPHYELRAWESKTKNPIILNFDLGDFEYQEVAANEI